MDGDAVERVATGGSGTAQPSPYGPVGGGSMQAGSRPRGDGLSIGTSTMQAFMEP